MSIFSRKNTATATATAEASKAPARTPSPPPTPTAPAAPVLVVPPTSGSGTLVPTGAASGANATGRTVRYAVEVEADLDGIVVPADFAGEVHAILGDAQG